MIKKIKKIIKKSLAIINIETSKIKKKEHKIIYIGSPLHGNIGDHAISIAICDLLKEFNKLVVEIPGEYFTLIQKRIMKYINEDDVIVITGGGLIGNFWLNEEEMIRKVIERFPNNKVIIMPQTYYFEDNEEGKKELEKLKKSIDNHKNIYLTAREENSYKMCVENFTGTKGIYLLPDVVLTLNYCIQEKREGVLLVLRQDKEKNTSSENIIKLLENKYTLKYTSTVINKRINFSQRKNIFKNKLDEFAKSKLVITDRLHGMIFAAITGTPCIAIDNKSKKVSGVYNWIKDLEYIKYCDDVKNVEKYIKLLKLDNTFNYTFNKKSKEKIIHFLNNVI